ncbi:hypothetical protein E1A91_A13G236900v1 [Gossypium mustelinum]|uniref:Uncharacterized protein n=3 Tax=Gossypium TaxID=3633 RepID=A0A5D2WLE7_GOSMU|nr:hypothetical protein ES288_A13G240200v1 [Gossypium darwinii]TYH93309.1 hypothetical protein ES332_A13G245000v1 [Gossypium tomentosum]TYJ02548.1 hypothetical protein E1A91_A13G236900v1 [Gossypium mustelinum]
MATCHFHKKQIRSLMLGLQLGDTAEPPSNLVADHAQKKHKQRLEVWRPWCC